MSPESNTGTAPSISAKLKTLMLAAEPPRSADPQELDAAFRAKLLKTLDDLRKNGTPFKFVEGFRSVERQQLLYGSGRPNAKPYGLPGPVVTQRDGVRRMSNH